MASLYTASTKSYDFQVFDDDDDDDELSDDEVFVNDKKRGGLDEENGASKPLMAPRRKAKSKKLHTEVRRGTACRTVCVPLCYAFTAVGSFVGIICLVVFLIHTFAGKLSFPGLRHDSSEDQLVGCTHWQVEDVWTQNFPKLITETAIRLNDVNSDGILDVILGFGTGADGYDVPSIVCDIYFGGTKPCFGGLLALDGKSGTEIWRHYTDHEVYAVNCKEDLNGDGVKDCLGAGRAGVFQAINGKDGSLLWNFGPQEAKNDIMNVYTPQYIEDQDGDGVVDLVVIHGGDPLADPGSQFRLSGRILVVSGKHGKVLKWVGVPDKRESYYSVQIHIQPDGTELVLFGTGGETHSGGLWSIVVSDLLKGNIEKARPIYQDAFKGVMTPPVMVDITSDGVEDIVMAMFNSTVIAFDGVDFHQIWNFTFPLSESYSTPAVGFFNDDDIPDFLVKYQVGPGFPIYYFSETAILDGRDGQPLLTKPLRDTVGAQASALTISCEGNGNDIFLHWTADCAGHEGEGREFEFLKGTNIHEQSRSDFCKLRYDTELISRIYAFSQHTKAPGFVVYESSSRKYLEYNNSVNTSALAQEYIKTHPDVAEIYHRASVDEGNMQTKTAHSGKDFGIIRHRPSGKGRGGSHRNIPYLAPEYEEDIPYAENHNVRKHGRYKSEKHRLQPGYYDYDVTMEDEGQSLAPSRQMGHGQPAGWPSSMQGSYANGNRQGWRNGGGSPYEAHMSYPGDKGRYGSSDDYNLFGMVDPYSDSVGSQRYPTDAADQDVGWNSGATYDVPYKRKLRRPRHPAKVKNKKSSVRENDEHLRYRRHVGPHDMDGVQRLISTGTLAPILDLTTPDANVSIDYIFATYWFFPAKTQAILPEDRDCIQSEMAREQQRFKPENRYYGMDHDAYEETITKECIEKNGHKSTQNRTYESQSEYNPFNIHMGQMTVYRLRLRCSCQGDIRVEKTGKKCAKILPFEKQGWTSYMGSQGDSHATPRRKT